MSDIEVMDFEASSLSPVSFPIEIGWTVGDVVHSYLIRPELEWTEWNDYVENHIHHISRDMLYEEGLLARDVLMLANESIGTGVVWSDALFADAFWLSRLEDAAGFKATFELKCIITMLNEYDVDSEEFDKLQLEDVETDPDKIHRAGYDAAMIKRAAYQCMKRT